MSDHLAELEDMIQSVAAEFTRRYRRYGMEREDCAQELRLWVHRHPGKVDEYLAEAHGEKMLGRTLRNEAQRFGETAKAQCLGYSLDDLYWWEKGEVEALLPAVFEPESWLEPPVSEDGGRSGRSPATGGNWIASLADLSQAFSKLAPEDQSLLRLYHETGLPNKVVAEMAGVDDSTASRRHDRAIGRLHKVLGGRRPRSTHEDGCECDVVGSRRAMSNAAARAVTDNNYQED